MFLSVKLDFGEFERVFQPPKGVTSLRRNAESPASIRQHQLSCDHQSLWTGKAMAAGVGIICFNVWLKRCQISLDSMFPDDLFFCLTDVSGMGTWDGLISPWPMLVDRMQLAFSSMISCWSCRFNSGFWFCDIFHCWIPFRFSGVKTPQTDGNIKSMRRMRICFFWTHLWICGCSCRVVLKNDLFKVVFYRHKANHNTSWPNLS